jgi:hypothetical protein
MPPNARKIHSMLRGLSTDDKVAALVVSLIERRPDAVDSTLSLIAAIGVLTRNLSLVNRYALSEAMRDCADMVEHREVERIE